MSSSTKLQKNHLYQYKTDYRDQANLMAWDISEKMFNLLGRYSKPTR